MINKDVYRCAILLARAGVSVLPIRPVRWFPSPDPDAEPGAMDNDGGKRPALASWAHLQKRIATEEEIQEWFNIDEIRGIAVISGIVSRNLEVLDFDQPEAFDAWMALCEANGLADIALKCPLSETPSGCRHLYFRCEAHPGPRTIPARKDRGDGKPTVVIEDRGEGGYSVIAPSPKEVHPDGRPYRMLSGRPDMLPVLTVAEREGFREMARRLNTYTAPEPVLSAPRRGPEADTPKDDGSLSPGDDYSARPDAEEKMAQILERHGWTCTGRSQRRSDWLRPGHASGAARSATLGWGRFGVFYVFSTDTPFEAETAYSPFQVYAVLEHNSNFTAAAAELSRLGYGDRRMTRQERRVPAQEWEKKASRNGHGPAADLYPEVGAAPSLESMPADFLTGPWREPAELIEPLPKFPIGAIPGAVQSMIVEVARVGAVSIDMAALAAIQTIAAATRGRVRIKVGQVFDVHSNMYGVVIAKPSEHKSYVLKQMLGPLRKLEDRIQIDAQPKIDREEAVWHNIENRILGLRAQLRSAKVSAEQREEKEKEIEELVLSRRPIPSYPQVLADDCNPTALAMIMGQQEDNSIALFSDEGGFFETLVQDGKNDFDFILKAANQERTTVNRVGRGFQKIHKPALTLLLMIQPTVASAISDNTAFRGKGLLSRFMYAYPPPSPFRPFDESAEISGRIQSEYADVIAGLFTIPNPVTPEDTGKCHEIMIAPGSEGMAAWKAFSDRINKLSKTEGNAMNSIEDWTGKLPGQVARLAGLFHLLQYPNIHTAISVPISEDCVKRAIAIADYLIPHATKTFTSTATAGRRRLAVRVAGLLRSMPAPPSVGILELGALLPGESMDDLEAACGLLLLAGYLRPMGVGPRSSGAKVSYQVNPLIYEDKK
jgi:replicative DNA helicase